MNDYPVALRGTIAPTLMWAHEHEVEQAALQQLRRIAASPHTHGVRVMPDVHVGKGATVGSVIAMEHAISPAAVGVDIGCGVSAVRTSLTAADLPDSLAPLRFAVEAAIPVGSAGYARVPNLRKLGLERGMDEFWGRFRDSHAGSRSKGQKAFAELGTLGGGNHFIELCVDGDDRVWLTLHAGSRNIGMQIGTRHAEIAMALPENQDLPDLDLAVFTTGTPQMAEYRRDLTWAQEYALRSRAIMMRQFQNALLDHFPGRKVVFDEPINVHHNYVNEELIDGRMMLVTRKGAIRAGRGELALIPGSMGTGSYVVRGLGNDASYQSASHGAGRRLSRGRAKDEFTLEDVLTQTAGIECRKDAGIIDELPGAYKDIHDVMSAQSDLVEVVSHLRTLMCVKG